MPRALDVRPTPVLMLVLALCAALLALAPAGPAHAQAPAAVVDAATAHLAEQLDVDPAGLELLRSEAVTWSDGCLGVYDPDIACTMALVDGFALWLSDGDVAYRYHTDATGTVVRLAESGIALGEIAGAPLPEGQVGPPPDHLSRRRHPSRRRNPRTPKPRRESSLRRRRTSRSNWMSTHPSWSCCARRRWSGPTAASACTSPTSPARPPSSMASRSG